MEGLQRWKLNVVPWLHHVSRKNLNGSVFNLFLTTSQKDTIKEGKIAFSKARWILPYEF